MEDVIRDTMKHTGNLVYVENNVERDSHCDGEFENN
jgi:hypothetical protein